MIAASTGRRRASRGFTLMETVVVVLVLAIAGTGIVALQGKLFQSQTPVKNMQVGSRLMLECAEHILATRRFSEGGYDVINANNGFGANQCGTGLPALSGYTVPSVSLTDPYTGAACPEGGTCKLATITQGGLANVTLLLVDY